MSSFVMNLPDTSLELNPLEAEENRGSEEGSLDRVEGMRNDSHTRLVRAFLSSQEQLDMLCDTCDFPSGLESHLHAVYEAECSDSALGLDVLKRYAIAMVDDDPMQLFFFAPRFIARARAGQGFQVKKETHIQAIEEWLRETRPDIVLFDYYLKGGDNGAAFVDVLKNRLPGVEFIGFSSSDSTKIQQEFLDAGAIGTVQKHLSDPRRSLCELAQFLEHLDQ